MKKLILIGLVALTSVSFGQFGMEMGGEPENRGLIKRDKRPYSDVQKKHQNKIVFSNEYITYLKEDESKFISKYNLGDPLYFRWYSEKTLEEGAVEYFLKKNGKKMKHQETKAYAFLYVVKINGKEMGFHESDNNKKELATTFVTASGYLKTNKVDDYKSSKGIPFSIQQGFHKLGNDFKPGTYDVEIDMYAVSFKMTHLKREKEDRIVKLSSGKLIIIATNSGIEEFTKTLCRKVKKPKGVDQNKELLAKIKDNFESTNDVDTEIVYLLNDWTVRKNDYGIVKGRVISSMVIYRKKDNSIWWMERLVEQEYIGGGAFEKKVSHNAQYSNEPLCPVCIEYYKSKN